MIPFLKRVLTDFSLAGRCFKINKCITFTYGLDTFQTVAFVLDCQVGESACKSFKSGISIPYSPLVFLDVSPVGFQSQMFWGLISPVQVPRVGVPDVGHKFLLLREKLCIFEIPSDCGSPHQGWGFR